MIFGHGKFLKQWQQRLEKQQIQGQLRSLSSNLRSEVTSEATGSLRGHYQTINHSNDTRSHLVMPQSSDSCIAQWLRRWNVGHKVLGSNPPSVKVKKVSSLQLFCKFFQEINVFKNHLLKSTSLVVAGLQGHCPLVYLLQCCRAAVNVNPESGNETLTWTA